MNKIKHPLNIPVVKETATERLADNLVELKPQYGKTTKHFNMWTVSGFMLSELGGAVIHTWLALDESGEMDGKTPSEKAQVLIDLLQRVANSETPTLVKTTPTPTPTVKPTPAKTLESISTDYGA